jgi:hypothetical protein
MSGEESDAIDPRIREKLEELNKWTEEINGLEKLFEQGNASFRKCLSEYSDKLKALADQIGAKSVAAARPYHEAHQRALAAQAECQRTVGEYEAACRLHVQARTDIQNTEQQFQSDGPDFDVMWQETMNQCTMKLRLAEEMKISSKERHESSMRDFAVAEQNVQMLAKQLRRAIRRTRPYFLESEKFKQHLISIKEQIELLTERIRSSKRCYAVTLKSLERISDEIHEKRNNDLRLPPSPVSSVSPVPLFSYHCPVPELDVSSAPFQRPAVRPAVQSPETSCSSGSSTCDTGPTDQPLFSNMSQLCLNAFHDVQLD